MEFRRVYLRECVQFRVCTTKLGALKRREQTADFGAHSWNCLFFLLLFSLV